MPLPYIFSLLFLFAALILLFYGLFILSLNTKSSLHILFFILCFCLSLWSFALSISNSAHDYETCLLWRRICAFGWGAFFSFLLHFIIILTEKDSILKKKWMYIPIYFPGILSVFVFGLYGRLAEKQYNLIITNTGWVNISYNTFWDILFNLYYISFSIIGILMLFNWAKQSKEKHRKKKIYIICLLFFLSLFLGTMTEFIINSMFSIKIPQIAPLIFLIPMTDMLYCVKRYGFMLKKKNNEAYDYSSILNGDSREKLYLNFSVAFILGGFVNVGAMYFTQRDSLRSVLHFSAIMAFIGIGLQVVQYSNFKLSFKDLLSNLILAFSIPILVLRYFEYTPIYAGLVPVLFIVTSIAFSQKRILILNGISSLFTLLWIWYKSSTKVVVFTSMDHVVRIILVLGIFTIAYYINRIYRLRIVENEEKLNAQKLLSRISSIFISTNESNLEDRINEVLKLCGESYKLDRIYVLVFPDGQKVMKFFEWCSVEKFPMSETTKEKRACKVFELLNMKHFLQQECECVSFLAATSEEYMEKEYTEEKETITTIINPLRKQDCVIGLMGVENAENKVKFKDYQKETFKVLAHLISDIMLKVDAEKEINYRVNYDPLTGLPNRAMFMNQARSAIKMAERSEKLVGIAFVDIDSFKYVNDTLGHDGGDSLLMKIGERISGCLRLYDTVARFGGDEFVIMIPQVSHVKDICAVAEKITDSFKKPLNVGNQEFFITLSMGVSVYPIDGVEVEDLVKSAAAAMYISKENGKNKYTMCSSYLQKEIEANANLTNSLHLAIQRKEFILNYQPQVNAITGEIVGVEALIRWNHPQNGLVSPGVFIPLAEKNGLINHIGQWVLQEACEQSTKWRRMGLKPIKMAVNLSLGQFLNPNLVEIVENIINKTQMDPTYLELEITESIATYDADYIIGTLNRLKALGLTISIDDFGTEYSSLSRLKIMPVDKIKIDMRFTQGIFNGTKDESIIKVMLQLGRTFGLKVLAEGVENERQLNFLKENLCDEIQGFYFYKPMPAEELEKILRKG